MQSTSIHYLDTAVPTNVQEASTGTVLCSNVWCWLRNSADLAPNKTNQPDILFASAFKMTGYL